MALYPVDILWPAVALVVHTYLVLVLILIQRVHGIRAGKVRPRDFKPGESERVPPEVCIANRNYMNLLEMPVLFYVVIILFYITGTVNQLALVLAWIYVGARILHSIVHLTYNNVLHRLLVFGTSCTVLAGLWLCLSLGLALAKMPTPL